MIYGQGSGRASSHYSGLPHETDWVKILAWIDSIAFIGLVLVVLFLFR